MRVENFCKYDLIVNTLLKHDEEENRRIIDDLDLLRYSSVMRSWASRINIDLSWDSKSDDNFKGIDKYIYKIKRDDRTYYGIWPWIRTGQLYEFRRHIPLDLLCLMHDTSEMEIVKRNDEEKEKLVRVEDEVINKALNGNNQEKQKLTKMYCKTLLKK